MKLKEGHAWGTPQSNTNNEKIEYSGSSPLSRANYAAPVLALHACAILNGRIIGRLKSAKSISHSADVGAAN